MKYKMVVLVLGYALFIRAFLGRPVPRASPPPPETSPDIPPSVSSVVEI